MTIAARGPVSMTTLLALGRISNLPTIWTNTLAGIVLAGGDWRNWRFGALLVAMSLFYIGGMYLNDYFDRAIDARERPERPIPSGAIHGKAVFIIGFGLLSVGLVVTATMGAAAVAVALLLGAAIVAYDFHHKGNPLAPIVMGACRALVYAIATVGVGGYATPLVIVAAVAVGAYVVGLTYAAQQEGFDKGRQSLAFAVSRCTDGGRNSLTAKWAWADCDLSFTGRLDRGRASSFGTPAGRRFRVSCGRQANRRHIIVRCGNSREHRSYRAGSIGGRRVPRHADSTKIHCGDMT